MALGVDAVEFDVQFTADGGPVALHDETLYRMAGVAARVRDYTESVLAGFDIGFLHGGEHRGQRLVPVARIPQLVPPPIALHVEIKDYDPVGETHLVRLLEALERHDGLSRAVFSSPHEETLADIARLAPACRRALLLFRRVSVPTDAARRAAHIGCVSVHPDAALVLSDTGGAELVQICHRHGMQVLTFTVNERGTMRKLMQLGVDGFFTDYPDRLLAGLSSGDVQGDARDDAQGENQGDDPGDGRNAGAELAPQGEAAS